MRAVRAIRRSSHPMPRAMVHGLQGDLTGDGDVIATAKHFLGDGGTFDGIDQGENARRPHPLIRPHGAGYYPALEAGVRDGDGRRTAAGTTPPPARITARCTATASCSTDVLKSPARASTGWSSRDWNGIQQVPGCTKDHCPQAVNAGIDMIMVPDDWKAFIANTVGGRARGAHRHGCGSTTP